MFKTYDFLKWFLDEVNESLKDKKIVVELLNKKEDMAQVGQRVKVFMQYVGIDYKDKGEAGIVKVVFYVVGRRVYNTKDDNIPKVMDALREVIFNLNYPIEEKNEFGYIADFGMLLEEKYNNTDTLEFIYSLVVGIPIVI